MRAERQFEQGDVLSQAIFNDQRQPASSIRNCAAYARSRDKPFFFGKSCTVIRCKHQLPSLLFLCLLAPPRVQADKTQGPNLPNVWKLLVCPGASLPCLPSQVAWLTAAAGAISIFAKAKKEGRGTGGQPTVFPFDDTAFLIITFSGARDSR